ncbi:hypothetical protein CWC18_03370 [Pseudoalteromonas aurantia]|uniref:Uncharacterized protein n=1 Tax=Pseudoalteromonas aurantia TaxID=43654 RepID=A0ABY2VXC0_9GAMM|nr:hypothetical protein CWC18_03370 [Pseudoalteromonas aurantia]TMO74234.1 hypothetical protein CWC20_11070 [Pseudoalteromonas aurantia]
MAFVCSQIWTLDVITHFYLLLLGICSVYGIYLKNINMVHITGFILLITGVNKTVFDIGLINNIIPADNLLLQGTLVYGTNLMFSLALALILIFRVQLSRIISHSKNIELTHFDGIFHWVFIYMATINLISLLEHVAWSYFEMKSWSLIYDNFERLVYIAWAVNCGALLTMMICCSKENRSDDASTF